jgi:hypothetical protein
MFTYYKKIFKEEEMLFDQEIARLYKIYKVRTKDDVDSITSTPNATLVNIIINDYITKNNIEMEELYYPSNAVLRNVYPARIYVPAIENFLKEYQWYGLIQEYKNERNIYKFIWYKK